MKTKEFIRRAEEFGFEVVYDDLFKNIKIKGFMMKLPLATIQTDIEKEVSIASSDYRLIKLCLVYAETPIEDREDTKKYIVILPDPNRVGKRVYVLGKSLGSVIVRNAQRHMLEGEDYHLTEKEIKRNHEYLWQFAKEVK